MESRLLPADKSAVILVDFQADFTEANNGSLAVPGTNTNYIDQVIAAVHRLLKDDLPVYATQDWHPPNHTSFYTNHSGKKPFDTIRINGHDQILWPPHCVRDTTGADILIDGSYLKKVVKKGTDPRFDSYSGFADDGNNKTELEDVLRRDGVEVLQIFGLATDFCVKATALDAIKAGFQTCLRSTLCRAVDPDATQSVLEQMQTQGVLIFE